MVPLAAYPLDPCLVEAFAAYAETGSLEAFGQLKDGPLDGGPASRDVVWSALTLMARLSGGLRMADGTDPDWERVSDLAPRWSHSFLRIALSKTDSRTDPEEDVIDVAVRSGLDADYAMACLFWTLLWLVLLCSEVSKQPPGELIRSFGRDDAEDF